MFGTVRTQQRLVAGCGRLSAPVTVPIEPLQLEFNRDDAVHRLRVIAIDRLRVIAMIAGVVGE